LSLTTAPHARLLASFLDGSWRAKCPPLSLTPAEVARAAPLLIGSGAAALGWRRIKDTPALKRCAEAHDLCQSGQILALEDARLDGALEYVAGRLNDVGIVPMIAKGWAVAQFYSARYLRAYGDFDLCAPPGKYELARETLMRLTPPQFSENDAGDIFVDCGPDLGDCTIDLHKTFGAAYMPPAETLFARSTPSKAGSADIRLLALEDHLRFVVMHWLRHGAWRPSGLATSRPWSRPFRRISTGRCASATTPSSPDGSARRSCSRIGCRDAVSIQCRRRCEWILRHGSSAQSCASGKRHTPGDSGALRQAGSPSILASSFTGCVSAGRRLSRL
jgi:hypothetical protein